MPPSPLLPPVICGVSGRLKRVRKVDAKKLEGAKDFLHFVAEDIGRKLHIKR
jgi:hypothetical protein